MKNTIIACLAVISVVLNAAEYQLSNIKIRAAQRYSFASGELQKHLELAGSKLAPGSGALEIFIGRNPGVKDKLQPGEARWLYKEGKLYFWGNEKKDFSGTLAAVYGFLEEKLGVRWIFPGEDGIFVPARKTIKFEENESYKRVPPYLWAFVRHGLWSRYDQVKNSVPAEWRIPDKQHKQLITDNDLFRLRHRNGRTMVIRYAHAFTKWPDRFEKSHPDYFGVGPYGKPAIPSQRNRAKLCLSNPAVIDQIIADWKSSGARQYLNVSPNDGTAGYCLCPKCMALDTRKSGESFYSHLTDRYLNFWNRVVKRAKTIRPDVIVTTYVYSYYRFPPRREKIEYPDNMLCGLVPAVNEDSGALFEAWKAVGMKNCFLRPNDTHPASAQIRGLEEHIFDKYQAARKSFQLYGIDYDSTLGVKARDLEHYIIERMVCAPGKSFEELADEFYSAYGEAAGVVKEFYSVLRPAGKAMYLKSAAAKRNKMVLDDSDITTENDKNYDQVLRDGLKKLEAFPQNKLSGSVKKRFARLIFSVKQNILVNKFFQEGDLALAGKKNDFNSAAKALWDFRAATALKFPEHYPAIVRRTEKRYWDMYQPFRLAGGGDGAQLADLAAGWRNSFDEPSLQGWRARGAFREITMKEASFDRYSVEIKTVKKSDTALYRPNIAVTPGAEYEVVYDVKAVNGGKFRIRVVAAGKTIANIAASAKGSHWVQKKGRFTVPEGVKEVAFYLHVSNLSDVGYFDNITLARLKK